MDLELLHAVLCLTACPWSLVHLVEVSHESQICANLSHTDGHCCVTVHLCGFAQSDESTFNLI